MFQLSPTNKSYWLSQLCESNYAKLLDLIPELHGLPATAMASADGKPALHIKLLERCPYTLSLELTHSFSGGFDALFEPALKLRVYLDARAVEVLSDQDRPFVLDALQDDATPKRIMDYKWTLNYFLSRWLDHCLINRYRFEVSEPRELEFGFGS